MEQISETTGRPDERAIVAIEEMLRTNEKSFEAALRSLYRMIELPIPTGVHRGYINEVLKRAGKEVET